MKKNIKNKNLIIIGAIFFAIFTSIFFVSKGSYATENEINNVGMVNNQVILECTNNNVSPSEIISCQINAKNFTTSVSSFSMDVILDNNLMLQNINVGSIWEGSGKNGIIDVYTDKNKTGDFEIASFTVKATDSNVGLDSTISLINIVYSDDNFDEYIIEDINKSMRIQSNIDTLSTLTVSGLTFDFDSNTTTYNLTLDLNETTISATPTNSNAIVSGDIGSKTLNFGKNTYTITVTSENGIQKVYTLNITRPESLTFDQSIVIDEEKRYLIFDENNFNVSSLLSKIDTTGEVKITNIENIEVNNNDLVATGYKISIKLSTDTYEYIIIILGDTNGDGLVSVADVSRIFQYYRGTNTNIEDAFIYAGDVKTDNKIKLTDVAKLYQYVKTTINTLK